MFKLVLASNSPRRKQILEEAGFAFTLLPVNLSETLKKNLKPEEQILDIARQKARQAVQLHNPTNPQDFLYLAADTMVFYQSTPLGKPADTSDACRMLVQLSGNSHQVITAVVLMDSTEGEVLSFTTQTKVQFKKLSKQQIEEYLKSPEPYDKAGAYGIQGSGGSFVERIDGDFHNVVGFPISEFSAQLTEKKINIERSPATVETFSELKKVLSTKNPQTKIIAVSKLQSTEKIRNLYWQGQTDFGENYVQEAIQKKHLLQDLNLCWHFVGHLQKNKVKQVVGEFDYLHAVDSVELCKKISSVAAQKNITQKVLLQLNLAQEESKHGFSIESFKQQLPSIMSLSHLSVVGLMIMPPLTNTAEENKKYFIELKKIQNELCQTYPSIQELSMGTTQDFLVAARCGATFVRLGTILFGKRP
jgi:MAF protein